MEQQPAVGEAADMESVEQFTYFMVRLESRAGDAGLEPRGLVERLGSGQKRSFARSGELLALLTSWANSEPTYRFGFDSDRIGHVASGEAPAEGEASFPSVAPNSSERRGPA
jgi:hypothetical protein